MTKPTLNETINNLSNQELKELIEKIENKLKNEDKVNLILVASGILAIKYFPIDKEDEAIKFAYKYLDKILKKRKGVGNLWGEISIDTVNVPVSEVQEYLEINND